MAVPRALHCTKDDFDYRPQHGVPRDTHNYNFVQNISKYLVENYQERLWRDGLGEIGKRANTTAQKKVF